MIATAKLASRSVRVLTPVRRYLQEPPPVRARLAREPWPVTLVPIGIIAVWWTLCLAVWAMGYPIAYTRTNAGLVTALTIACTAMVSAGFLVVARRLPGRVNAAVPGSLPLAVRVGVVASIALLPLWAEFYTGYHLWELGSALLDQGAAFTAAAARVTEGTSERLGIIAVQAVSAPLTLTAVPVTALAWFEQRRHGVWFASAVAVQIAMSILVGRDYYLTMAAFLIGAAWLLSRVRRGLGLNWRVAVVSALGFATFLLAFVARKMSRGLAGGDLPCAPGARECVVTKSPDVWETLSYYVSSYMSQSFEGLGRAFSGDWRFGGGYSHSSALDGILTSAGLPARVTITDQLSAHSWSDTDYWSTGWAWIANDVPWVAVPVVVGVLGALFALTWRRAVADADWLSVTLFSYGLLMLFFLAQNNMLTSNGPAYLGYLILVLAFLGREVRDRRRHRASGGQEADDPTSAVPVAP